MAKLTFKRKIVKALRHAIKHNADGYDFLELEVGEDIWQLSRSVGGVSIYFEGYHVALLSKQGIIEETPYTTDEECVERAWRDEGKAFANVLRQALNDAGAI